MEKLNQKVKDLRIPESDMEYFVIMGQAKKVITEDKTTLVELDKIYYKKDAEDYYVPLNKEIR